jgi:predicted nucleic acid-binding protein
VYVTFKNGTPSVIESLRICDTIGVDITVISELYSGFALGRHELKNRADLQSFLKTPRIQVLEHNLETADYYALIFKQLRKKGKPIPTNDIWIASTAMQYGFSLFSLDKHFKEVNGLLLWSYHQ